MKKVILIIFTIVSLMQQAQAYSEIRDCKPCTEADVVGAAGGMTIGAYVAYSSCVAAAIAAGTLTAGAGFAAGMAICGGVAAGGAVTGGELGHLAGELVDDIRDCCE
jgi:energy-converting hydrogenase Eha subunit H